MNSEDIVRIENLSNKNDTFIIRWNITYLCNYNCDFCIQGNKKQHIEKSKGESIEIRNKICNNLITFIEEKINKKYKYLEIYLIGGEVTILKDFPEIIKKLVDCKFEGNIKFHLTTNLSANNELLYYLVDLFNRKYKYDRTLEISASYYKKFTNEENLINKVNILYKNKTSSNNIFNAKKFLKIFKKILKKYPIKNDVVKNIANKIEPIHVNIDYPICTDEDYKEYIKFKNKYEDKARRINFIIIRNYKKSISENLKKKLNNENNNKRIKVTLSNKKIYYSSDANKISLHLDNNQQFNPKGYSCDAGTKSISIGTLGVVSRCPTCKEKTIIGNMQEKIPEIPIEKIICPSNSCNCSYYNIIEKIYH